MPAKKLTEDEVIMIKSVEENGEGFFDEENDYVPTEKELRKRFPTIPADRNMTSDRYRKQIWRYPVTRHLKPMMTYEDGVQPRLNSQETRRHNTLKTKEAKLQKEFMLGLIKEEMEANNTDISPSAVMQMLLKQALANDDTVRAEEIATKLLEFEKPKLARIDKRTSNVETVNTKEDLELFLDGKIDSDELERRSEANKGTMQ